MLNFLDPIHYRNNMVNILPSFDDLTVSDFEIRTDILVTIRNSACAPRPLLLSKFNYFKNYKIPSCRAKDARFYGYVEKCLLIEQYPVNMGARILLDICCGFLNWVLSLNIWVIFVCKIINKINSSKNRSVFDYFWHIKNQWRFYSQIMSEIC